MNPDPREDKRYLSAYRPPSLGLEYIAAHYGERKDDVLRELKVWDTLGELEYLTIFEIYLRIERELGLDISGEISK